MLVHQLKCIYLRKLNDLKVRQECQIKISSTFAALENLSYSEDTSRSGENVKENIKTSAKDSLCLFEFNQHKP